MINIDEYSEKMKNAELFQGMGFQKIIKLNETEAEFEFLAETRHCHSGNIVQGGYVTGWIDTTMAHAAMAANNFSVNPLTLELKISFFKPAHPGTLTTSASIIKLGKSMAFIEGVLMDGDGNILAKGSSSNRLIKNEKFPGRNNY